MGEQIKRDKAQLFPNLDGEQHPLMQAQMDARKRKILYHYTNIEALFAILKYKQFKFNRIDRVNDLREKSYFSPEKEYIYTYFVSSFSHDLENNESIPLWHMYTNGGYGVRIGLKSNNEAPFLSAINQDGIVGVYEKDGIKNRIPPNIHPRVRITDILYPSNEKDLDIFFVGKSDILLLDDAVAAIKNECWEYENETRIIVSLTPIKDLDVSAFPIFTHLFVPFDFSQFNEIEVMFSPFMSDEVKDSVKLMCEKIGQEIPVKINYQNSIFDGEIKRKE